MHRVFIATVAGLSILASTAAAQASRTSPFTVAQVRSYPFPTELTASATGARIAWAFNEQGRRNIFVAEGPTFAARALTHYDPTDRRWIIPSGRPNAVVPQDCLGARRFRFGFPNIVWIVQHENVAAFAGRTSADRGHQAIPALPVREAILPVLRLVDADRPAQKP